MISARNFTKMLPLLQILVNKNKKSQLASLQIKRQTDVYRREQYIMSTKRDYYEVLGVSKNATADEIKSQYRKLALKFHPDRNKSPDASEYFKEVSEAYAILSDPEKRKVYDNYGHAGVDGRYSTEDIFRGS